MIKFGKRGLWFAAICAACGVVPAASADELSRITAGEMPTVRDRFEGLGIRSGQFWILPTLETGLFYDSNVFATSSGERDDGGVYVAPNVAVRSDFGRHALNLRLGMEHYEYFDLSSQSRTDFDGELDGRIDVHSDTVLLGGVKGGRFNQSPSDIEYPVMGDGEPGKYYTLDTWGSVNHAINRVSLSVRGAYKLYDYDAIPGNGGAPPIAQDFRDGDVVTVGGRVGYLVSPGYKVFGDFSYNWRDYDQATIVDSDGWRALAGVEFEITHLVTGELAVGYMEQTYDLPGSPTNGSLSYHGALAWNPTQLMTVRLDADRTIEDSTLDQTGRTQDSVKLAVDYEVLRTLIFSPSLGFSYNDYDSAVPDDTRLDAGANLEYRMNRFMSVGGRYKYTYDDNSGSPDWDRHLLGIYAKARF